MKDIIIALCLLSHPNCTAEVYDMEIRLKVPGETCEGQLAASQQAVAQAYDGFRVVKAWCDHE